MRPRLTNLNPTHLPAQHLCQVKQQFRRPKLYRNLVNTLAVPLLHARVPSKTSLLNQPTHSSAKPSTSLEDLLFLNQLGVAVGLIISHFVKTNQPTYYTAGGNISHFFLRGDRSIFHGGISVFFLKLGMHYLVPVLF